MLGGGGLVSVKAFTPVKMQSAARHAHLPTGSTVFAAEREHVFFSRKGGVCKAYGSGLSHVAVNIVVFSKC